MDPKVKHGLVIAAAIVLPLGAVGLAWYWWKRRKGGAVLAWQHGLNLTPAAELATTAGVGLQQFALAKMMQSEGRADVDRIARGWVAINDAKAAGFKLPGGQADVFKIITLRKPFTDPKTHVVHARSGYFGEQAAGGRYATTKAPTKATIELAGKVLRGEIPDPTHGSTRFLDAKAFKTQAGVKRTFASVDQAWRKEGFQPRSIPGAASDFLVYSKMG